MHNWTGVVLWLVGTLRATYINKNGQDVNVSHLISGWLSFGVHIGQPSIFAPIDKLFIVYCPRNEPIALVLCGSGEEGVSGKDVC